MLGPTLLLYRSLISNLKSKNFYKFKCYKLKIFKFQEMKSVTVVTNGSKVTEQVTIES